MEIVERLQRSERKLTGNLKGVFALSLSLAALREKEKGLFLWVNMFCSFLFAFCTLDSISTRAAISSPPADLFDGKFPP